MNMFLVEIPSRLGVRTICSTYTKSCCFLISGSGKTTFLNHYQGSDVSILTEPVDKWRDLNGNNLLQLMYTAPFRHSYTFQSYVQLTMTQLHNMKVSTPIKMLERSVYSSRHVFGM